MRSLQNLGIFFARTLISLLFIFSGIDKILDWQNAEGGLISLLCDWHNYLGSYPQLQDFITTILLWTPVILGFIVVFQLVGGLMLLLGIKPRIGALLLILFLVPMTILLHHFWFLPSEKKEVELAFFMKNMAIFGGLILILIHGASLKKKPMEFPKNEGKK